MKQRLVVAIDAGAAWSRGMLVSFAPDGSASLESSGRGGPGNPNHIGEEAAVANVSSLILSLLAAAGAPGTAVAAVAVSSTLADTGALAARVCPDARKVLIPDPVAAFFSCKDSPAGVVVTAGTGSMAFRVGPAGVDAHAGGWGWALGDEGGAVSLGRDCLRAALDAHEGGPPTVLRDRVAQLVGGEGPDPIYAHVYRRGLTPTALAAVAPLVTAAALDGDMVASAILDVAARQLSQRAAHLLRGTDTLAVAGGLAPSLADRVRDHLSLEPAVVRDGVVGAAFLAARDLGVPADREELARMWAAHSPEHLP
jgi:glucosamine kinase